MASLRVFVVSIVFLSTCILNIHHSYSLNSTCLPDNHKALFIFGDSSFDNGNNDYINATTFFQANFPPYGETFFKYPSGRFSNGRVIPDFIGFKEGNVACCGGGPYRGDYSCGGKRGIEEYELCNNVNEHVFFDSFHPTESAAEHYAKLMWNGNRDVIDSYNLKQLFHETTFISKASTDHRSQRFTGLMGKHTSNIPQEDTQMVA
ncbi:hypothetical protein Fmac_010808 [Flemingia macrophylla]|uniref:Uncharacterized protein n=1 Tax=Flemingia macrophylla TaxID=520843 RepID=A0ABD1MLF1_9FABA